MAAFRIAIAGGGFAAVEAALRVRRLLGNLADVTLIAPNRAFRYRPMAVAERFSLAPQQTIPLERIAGHTGAALVRDELATIDSTASVVTTASGRQLEFDALLVATGARQTPVFEHATTFDDARASADHLQMLHDLEKDQLRRLAFVAPRTPIWPFPLYELTLMTAAIVKGHRIDGASVALVTAESRPLASFGERVSDAVRRRLDVAGVDVHASSLARVPSPGRLVLDPAGTELEFDRIVAMPQMKGPGLRGIPTTADGFIPVDDLCRVRDAGDRIFAAGDVADLPVKHGSLAAQMADTAAVGIARLAGADADPAPLEPVLRGKLLTGASPLYIQARLAGDAGLDSELFDEPPWRKDDKVVADELGNYLAGTWRVHRLSEYGRS